MTATPPATDARSRPLIALCFFVAVFEGFDIQAIGVAAPLLVTHFGLSYFEIGAVLSIDMVGCVIGAATGGWLADRVGRKLVLICAVSTFGVLTLAMTAASGYSSLLIIRLVIGLGLGAAMPNLIAIAIENSQPSRRTRTVTMIFCGLPAGGALSALVGGMTMPEYGWVPLFVIGGLLPLGITPMLHIALSTKCFASEVPTSNAPTRALHGLFGARRYTATMLMWLALFLTMMILYLMLKWLPLLVEGKALDPATASASALAFTTAGIVGILVTGYLVDKYGAIWPIALTYSGAALSMFALALSDSSALALASTGLAGFCVLGALYSLYGIVPMFYPPDCRGTGIGAAVAIGRLGSIVGPLAVAGLFANGFTVDAVFLSTVPIAIVACLAAIAAPKAAYVYPN